MVEWSGEVVSMKCIDIDKRFRQYLERWIEDNRDHYASPEDMEDDVQTVYETWLTRPQTWLNGLSPRGYFEQVNDPAKLIELMLEYERQGVVCPEPLLDRIIDLGDASESELMKLVSGTPSEAVAITAVSLLREFDSAAPLGLYVKRISAYENTQDEGDPLADAMADALKGMGTAVIEPCLEALKTASRQAAAAFLDVLCTFPSEPRVYDPLVEFFKTATGQRDLGAMFLGEYGDDRAIPVLASLLESEDISYVEYIEIKAAIEALGGEVTTTREFPGDPHYEAMLKMDQEDA